MNKKIFRGAIASFAVVSMMATTGIAFAGSNQTNVGNYSHITNNVASVSSTGGNAVGNSDASHVAYSSVGDVKNTDIDTGNADSIANSAVVANSNGRIGDSYGGWYGYNSSNQRNISNIAVVSNDVSATSFTGSSSVGNSSASHVAYSGVGDVKNTDIDTGNAESTTNSIVLTNSNVRRSILIL